MFEPVFTLDELVAALRNTGLPTILVEGRCDMYVYRWIEDSIGTGQVNVLPCGGRDMLLQVYSRRSDFEHVDCVFLADKDMWLFDGKYAGYDIVFTCGYSIENDILDCDDVHRLFSSTERIEFESLSSSLAEWFAFEVEEYLAGRTCNVNVHIDRLLGKCGMQLDSSFRKGRMSRAASDEIVETVRQDFLNCYRGKNLLDLFIRILGRSKRISVYRRNNLLEIGAKSNSSVKRNRLLDEVRARLK